MQELGILLPSRIFGHDLTGCGALNLRFWVGGCAYGIESHEYTFRNFVWSSSFIFTELQLPFIFPFLV